MSNKYTDSFKVQAVEKALTRSKGVSVRDVSESLGVGFSTLQKWIRQSKNQEFDTSSPNEIESMTKEKRPQDWTLEERLNVVITCGTLSEGAISELCRERGIFPHHINQWKTDFISGHTANANPKKQVENKKLKSEVKTLKKELTRKDKALAETAALLVLQKKVRAIWGSDEDSSQ